jgi:hypothetical protein
MEAWMAVKGPRNPNQFEKGTLAAETGMSEEQVITWFSNTRSRRGKQRTQPAAAAAAAPPAKKRKGSESPDYVDGDEAVD